MLTFCGCDTAQDTQSSRCFKHPKGPLEPFKRTICELWAAGFIVICTNQTIGLLLGTLGGLKKKKKREANKVRYARFVFVSRALQLFITSQRKTKTFSWLSHLRSPSPCCWHQVVSHIHFYLFIQSFITYYLVWFISSLCCVSHSFPNPNPCTKAHMWTGIVQEQNVLFWKR